MAFTYRNSCYFGRIAWQLQSVLIVLLILLGNRLALIRPLTTKDIAGGMASASQTKEQLLHACNFEVFGRVQGVFFRKYTEAEAKRLGIRGWCRNTRDGTVEGQLEGPLAQLNEMKHWLQKKGSPSSVIEKVEFSPAKEIATYTFEKFSIRR